MRTTGLLLALLACPGLAGIGLTAAPLRLRLDPAASSVTFHGQVNIGINSFVGRVDAWSLDLTMPADAAWPDHAVFTCNVRAMKTGKARRDEHLREWMESTLYPEIRYELKSVRRSADGLEADGELTIHGRTRPLTMPFTLTRDGPNLTVRGEVTLDYRDFDLKIVRLVGLITVKPRVRVTFVATGVLE